MLKPFLLWLAACLALGCSSKPSLIGTWTSKDTVGKIPRQSEDTYSEGGRYQCVTNMQAPNGKGIIERQKGTWKLDDKGVLSVNLTDLDWEFVGGTPERAAIAKRKFEETEQEVLAALNKIGPLKVNWHGRDEFTLIYEGKIHTFNRKK